MLELNTGIVACPYCGAPPGEPHDPPRSQDEPAHPTTGMQRAYEAAKRHAARGELREAETVEDLMEPILESGA